MKNLKTLFAKILTVLAVAFILYAGIITSLQVYSVNNYIADAILAFVFVSMLAVFPVCFLIEYLETEKL